MVDLLKSRIHQSQTLDAGRRLLALAEYELWVRIMDHYTSLLCRLQFLVADSALLSMLEVQKIKFGTVCVLLWAGLGSVLYRCFFSRDNSVYRIHGFMCVCVLILTNVLRNRGRGCFPRASYGRNDDVGIYLNS